MLKSSLIGISVCVGSDAIHSLISNTQFNYFSYAWPRPTDQIPRSFKDSGYDRFPTNESRLESTLSFLCLTCCTHANVGAFLVSCIFEDYAIL